MLGRVRRSARRVNRFDEDLVRRSAAIPRTPLDRGLKTLSRSANKGRLWFTVAAVLAARKGPTRRAALRGVGAIAFASASANLLGKPLFPRRRPAAELVPEHRRLTKRPTSSSFPSGHSASAVAFTAAVAMEYPLAGALLAPLAAAVAYSRVHTGVHWPTDVAAGAAIGAGAAYATRHWWPDQPAGPALTAHRAELRPLPRGRGLLVLVNRGSGPDGTDPAEEVARVWPEATVIFPEEGTDLVEQLTARVSGARDEVAALGVAGGDGTVAAVAAVAAEHELPLVLVPAGTLNHFARDLGVATLEDSAAAVAAGTGVAIDLAQVAVTDADGSERRWFVNTVGLGGYPEMVRLREHLETSWGKWLKWPAGALAMARTLRHARPLSVRINGEPRSVWMLFVGNGPYSPKGFAPSHRPALDTGLLDVRYVRADVPYSRARFVAATLTRTLTTSHVYRQRDMAEVDVQLLDGHRRVAADGEVGPLGFRFEFSSRPRALSVYRP